MNLYIQTLESIFQKVEKLYDILAMAVPDSFLDISILPTIQNVDDKVSPTWGYADAVWVAPLITPGPLDQAVGGQFVDNAEKRRLPLECLMADIIQFDWPTLTAFFIHKESQHHPLPGDAQEFMNDVIGQIGFLCWQRVFIRVPLHGIIPPIFVEVL
jgi:hypothetical protein